MSYAPLPPERFWKHPNKFRNRLFTEKVSVLKGKKNSDPLGLYGQAGAALGQGTQLLYCYNGALMTLDTLIPILQDNQPGTSLGCCGSSDDCTGATVPACAFSACCCEGLDSGEPSTKCKDTIFDLFGACCSGGLWSCNPFCQNSDPPSSCEPSLAVFYCYSTASWLLEGEACPDECDPGVVGCCFSSEGLPVLCDCCAADDSCPDDCTKPSPCKGCPGGDCDPLCTECSDGTWLPPDEDCPIPACSDCPGTNCPEDCVLCGSLGIYLPEYLSCIQPECPNPLNPECGGGGNIPVCYSYTSNDPIFQSSSLYPAVTQTWTATEGQTDFQYSNIATICEIPDELQLCVFVTKDWDGSGVIEEDEEEVQMTFVTATQQLSGDDINYGFYLETNSDGGFLKFHNPLSAGDIVKLSRCSDDSKMLFHFTEGAKLSATELNAAFHQLLFLIQEKQFKAPTINHYHPVSGSVSDWVSGSSYVLGDLVKFTVDNVSTVYTCLSNHTASSSNSPDVAGSPWVVQGYTTNGFVLDSGGDIAGPIVFSLQGVEPGDALVWSGSRFQGGSASVSTSLEDLSNVDIDGTVPLENYHVLSWDAVTNTWVNGYPNLSSANLINPLFSGDIEDSGDGIRASDWMYYTGLFDPFNGTHFPTAYVWRDGPQSGIGVNTEWANAYKVTLDNGSVDGSWVIPNPPTIYDMVRRLIPATVDPITWFATVDEYVNRPPSDVSIIKATLKWDLSVGMDINTKKAFWDSPSYLYHKDGFAYIPTVSDTSGGKSHSPFKMTLSGDTTSKIHAVGIEQMYLNPMSCGVSTLALNTVVSGAPRTYSSADLETLSTDMDASDKYLLSVKDLYFQHTKNLSWGTGDTERASFLRSLTIEKESSTLGSQIETFSWSDLMNLGGQATLPLYTTVLFPIPRALTYINNLARQTAELGDITYEGSQVLSGDLDSSERATIHWFLAANISPGNTPDISNVLPVNPLSPNAWPSAVSGTYPTSGTVNLSAYHFDSGDINPSDPDEDASNTNNLYIGSGAIWTDINQVFSAAGRYVEEPRDRYVFSVFTTNASLLYTSSSTENLTVDVDYGFNNVSYDWTATGATQPTPVGLDSSVNDDLRWVWSKLNRSNVFVYTRNVRVVTKSYADSSADTTHIAFELVVEVPRLKYIGYTRALRSDLDIDDTVEDLTTYNSEAALWTNYDTHDFEFAPSVDNWVWGLRHEVAVRFVRMGIPANMWINVKLVQTPALESLL